jgi:hypothetical protein
MSLPKLVKLREPKAGRGERIKQGKDVAMESELRENQHLTY